LARMLKVSGYAVDTLADAAWADQILHNSRYRAVIADLTLHDLDGRAVMRSVKHSSPDAAVIFIANPQQEEAAKRLVAAGAAGYLIPPFDSRRIASLLKRGGGALPIAESFPGFYNIIGKSAAIRSVHELIRKVSDTSSTVLISGESGSGKELVARAIHSHNGRAAKPFVVVHCGAIPDTLLESELFGHERGAFTGAYTDKQGLFQSAGAGTLLLDEIGEITPAMQVKLLRVLEAGVARPVGSVKDVDVSARIIAATNRNLTELVEQRTFREDLFYRLNVFPIRVPPLRERRDDVPLLIRYFLRRISEERGSGPIEVNHAALDLLYKYWWPGNIRELENVIERAAILSSGGPITEKHLPRDVHAATKKAASTSLFDLPFKVARNAFERNYIKRVLDRCEGNVAQAARTAGVSRTYFYEIIKKYGVK
ncbi:MAG: sigma-54-dependent Fis family transcriptional regulator, partial [Planctomycetes bacterium]|nr:sigma-54-dependent Fis family transcriptional regulator [Planctomycetota bacterium]